MEGSSFHHHSSHPQSKAVTGEAGPTARRVDYEDLKKSGYIFQRDAEHFTVRLRIPGGALTSRQIASIGKIAEEYGRGTVHLTTRQGIEIPWVSFERLGEVSKALEEVGTPPGSCGPRVRNISACVGLPTCPHANIDSLALAKKIDERFLGAPLPTKLKIAVAGCPNSCSNLWINDIGVMGVVRPRIIPERCDGCGACARTCKEGAIKLQNGVPRIDYSKCIYCGECVRACPTGADVADREGHAIVVGGNTGRHPRLASKLVDFADEEAVLRVIENGVRLFGEEGERGERFSRMIERIGLGRTIQGLLS